MVNSCSVYGCKSNYKTTGNGNYVSVFKFPDNTSKHTEWFRKLPNKEFQITKTSRDQSMYQTFLATLHQATRFVLSVY